MSGSPYAGPGSWARSTDGRLDESGPTPAEKLADQHDRKMAALDAGKLQAQIVEAKENATHTAAAAREANHRHELAGREVSRLLLLQQAHERWLARRGSSS